MSRALPLIQSEVRRFPKTMIRQDTCQIAKQKFPQVIRCVAVGKTHDSPVIAVGSQDRNLYLLDDHFEEFQKIPFTRWVRSVALGDLTGDGNDELIVGGGDNSLHIFLYKPELHQFNEIYEYPFEHFVNSCIITDITGDGEMEILVGAWDQTIHALKLFEDRLSLLWVQKCDKRVNVLKSADVNSDGRNEIVVLFRGGGLGVFSPENCEPLWLYDTPKELLCVDVGPVDELGNPYIIAGGDDAVLYFLNEKGELAHQIETNDRITALSLGDIDGDSNKDLIISEGEKVMRVFKFLGDSPESYEVKWIHRIKNTNTCLKIVDFNEDSQNEILFGGYQSYLTAIKDNYYGADPPYFTRDL